MRRREYLNRLEALLSALPEQERQDAMDYYEEFFDAAGPEKEEQTMEELGSPEQVAQKILEGADLNPTASADRDRKLFWRIVGGAGVLVVLLAAALGVGLMAGRDRQIAPPVASGQPAEPSGTAEGPLPTASSAPAASGDGTALYPMEGLQNTLSAEIQEGTLIVEQDASLTQMQIRTEDLKPDCFSVAERANGYAIRYTGSNHEEGKNPRIEVTLPASAGLETLDIQLAVGRASLGDLKADEITLEIETGTLKTGVLTASQVTVDNLLGQVNIERIAAAEEVDLSCGVGKLQAELEGDADEYALQAECGTGVLQIDGQPVQEGRIERNGEQSRKIRVDIGTGTGDITFQQ